MSIWQMIESWGVILGEESISQYMPEYLLQNYSSHCYFIDFFPETINRKYTYKYDQIEKKVYNLIYDRMYNVILKLWLYDNLYFESELLYEKMSFKRMLSTAFF